MAKISKLTRQEISLEGSNLQAGETVTILCPECDGGTSKAKTLSITKKESGSIAFICFRDSCQIKGYLKASGGSPVKKEITKKKPLVAEKLIEAQHEEVPPPTELLVQEKYNVSLTKHYCRWDSKMERVLMPIFDSDVELRGYIARSYTGAEPKALTFKEADYAGPAWYTTGFIPTSSLIIVEDPVSAMSLNDLGVDAVALLGTHISEETATMINREFYKTVYLSLDVDAFAKAVKSHTLLQNCKLAALPKDIKDMSVKERIKWLEENNVERNVTTTAGTDSIP